jgi:hypothetical protein
MLKCCSTRKPAEGWWGKVKDWENGESPFSLLSCVPVSWGMCPLVDKVQMAL